MTYTPYAATTFTPAELAGLDNWVYGDSAFNRKPSADGDDSVIVVPPKFVMAVLVTAIHVLDLSRKKTWMAGTRPLAGPAMTKQGGIAGPKPRFRAGKVAA